MRTQAPEKPESTSAAPAAAATTQPAKVELPKNVTNTVLKQVHGLMEARTIVLPADYSVENALRSAWFYIQNSDNKDKILTCTVESQANALYDMVIQACDIGKKQGYLIPYGAKLCFQRSYFGDVVVAKRVRPGIEIYYDVIYKGEKFTPKKESTRYGLVTKVGVHEQDFPRKSGEIVGAYCGIVDENGEDMGVEIMSIDQIKQSWKKSKTYGEKSATFHNEQPDQACLRTVIRRRCKPIINSSNDAALLESVRRQDEDAIDGEIDREVEEKANKGAPLALGERNWDSSKGDDDKDHAGEDLPDPTDPNLSAPRTPTAEEVTFIVESLGLNPDQVQYVADQLKEAGSSLSSDQFLATCQESGIKGWNDVNKRLQVEVAKGAQPTLVGGTEPNF